MANVTITLLVDTTKLHVDPNYPLQKCCTIAQMGGKLTEDSTGDIRNYISEVNIGDIITWNAITNSTSMATGTGSTVVNITGVAVTTVFGQVQLLPLSLIQGATGGTSVEGGITSGSEGDLVTYTVSFNFVVHSGDTVTASQTYSIDPKIRVHSTSDDVTQHS